MYIAIFKSNFAFHWSIGVSSACTFNRFQIAKKTSGEDYKFPIIEQTQKNSCRLAQQRISGTVIRSIMTVPRNSAPALKKSTAEKDPAQSPRRNTYSAYSPSAYADYKPCTLAQPAPSPCHPAPRPANRSPPQSYSTHHHHSHFYVSAATTTPP